VEVSPRSASSSWTTRPDLLSVTSKGLFAKTTFYACSNPSAKLDGCVKDGEAGSRGKGIDMGANQ